MRKSVGIIVFLIYIISIIAVSVLGGVVEVVNPTIYVEQVKFTNPEIYEGVIYLQYYLGVTFQLKWEVLPENATSKQVIFPHDPANGAYSIDDHGLITLYKNEGLNVKVQSTDGSNKSDTITLLVY